MKNALLKSCMLASCLAITAPSFADIAAGKTAHAQGNYKEAIKAFEEDLENPNTSFEANWRTGLAYRHLDETKASLTYLKTAIEINPDDAEVQFLWGASNGEMAGKASIFSAPGYGKACKKAFERAVELDPSHVRARKGLVSFYLQAPSMFGGSKEKAALQAVELKEYNMKEGQLLEAQVYLGTEKPEAAMKVFSEILNADPNDHTTKYRRANAAYRNGQYDLAFEDFSALTTLINTEITGDEADFIKEAARTSQYYIGAIASKSKSRTNEGIEILKNYLNAKEFDYPIRQAFAHYYLANLYLHIKDKDQAKLYMANAKKLNTKNKELKKLLKKLKKDIKNA